MASDNINEGGAKMTFRTLTNQGVEEKSSQLLYHIITDT
jgi:hypothetical protein